MLGSRERGEMNGIRETAHKVICKHGGCIWFGRNMC